MITRDNIREYLRRGAFSLRAGGEPTWPNLRRDFSPLAGVIAGGRAVAAGAPAFVEIAATVNVGSTTSTEITLSKAIPAGSRVVLCAIANSAPKITSATSDTRGNVYAVHAAPGNDGNATQAVSICSAHVATELQVGDKITVAWSTSSYSAKSIIVCVLSGCAASGQPDVTQSRTVYSASVSEAKSTLTAPTVVIGALSHSSSSYAYTGGAWTTVTNSTYTGRRLYVLTAEFATADSKNPGGTWGTAGGLANAWVAFK